MKTKTITTALAAFLLSVPSQAALVDLGNVTQDTNSGLSWLDATATAGMSYNDVSLQLGPGGAFEGYRYATLPELESFLVGAGGTAPFLGSDELPLDGWVTVLLDLWGITAASQPEFNLYTSVLWGESVTSTQTEFAFVINPETGKRQRVEVEVTAARVETGILQNFYGGGYATARFGVGEYQLQKTDYFSSELGSALVTGVQNVPEPSGATLLGLGGLALVFRRRRG
jgi:hypothetical protein